MSDKKNIRKPTNKLKTLDKVLIVLGTFMVAFVIAMIVTYWKFESVPDALIVGVMGSGSSEAILCCIIQCVNKKVGIQKDDPLQYM